MNTTPSETIRIANSIISLEILTKLVRDLLIKSKNLDVKRLSKIGLILVLSNYFLPVICLAEENPVIALDELVQAANAVLADVDNVRASKDAGKVFAAAHALKIRSTHEAESFFVAGLKLAPWQLEEQLAYAEVLLTLNKKEQAKEIAEMIVIRSESDNLTRKASKLLGNKFRPILFNSPPIKGPWICLVRVGEVNQVALNASLEKLEKVLGIPVVICERSVSLGKPHRSALERWSKEVLVKHLNWSAPELKFLLQSKNVDTASKLTPEDIITAARKAIQTSETNAQLKQFEENVAFLKNHDQQWDAEKLIELILPATEGIKNINGAVIIGITEIDIYSNESNFIFGTAQNGKAKGLVSFARYRADFNEEPPQLARLTQRMHKQILSTVGNALGIPRPTDPTSARAYPTNLAEHDAKSEFMSEMCITGFEKALNIKLPLAAHKTITPQ
jgi:predicted Zn-dependent protease